MNEVPHPGRDFYASPRRLISNVESGPCGTVPCENILVAQDDLDLAVLLRETGEEKLVHRLK